MIFPSESSGKFNPTSLHCGSEYEVQGIESPSHSLVCSNHPTSHSPFGSYPSGRYSHSNPNPNPIPHPPASARFQRRVVKKCIVLANLSARDPQRPSSSKANRLTYTVVTQVIISLDNSQGECNVVSASEMVQKQVGFSVVLLDSKLYPLANNDSTSGLDFWKSTRKIIAASHATYEKLSGVCVGGELNQLQVDDNAITEPTRKKIKLDEDDSYKKMDQKIDAILNKLTFVDDMRRVFECVVCRLPVKLPVVSPCCQRIIGCKECVSRWLETNRRCPLCSVSGRTADAFDLKGIDELIGFFRASENSGQQQDSHSQPAEAPAVPPVVDVTSDDEFEDLPNFNMAHSQ